MADSGLYVGQCKPCHIVVRNNVAERNAVGYEGTNASGDMTVVGNRFVGNRVGATTDSDHQEAFLPQNGSTMVGNVVADNNQADTPEQATAVSVSAWASPGARTTSTRAISSSTITGPASSSPRPTTWPRGPTASSPTRSAATGSTWPTPPPRAHPGPATA